MLAGSKSRSAPGVVGDEPHCSAGVPRFQSAHDGRVVSGDSARSSLRGVSQRHDLVDAQVEAFHDCSSRCVIGQLDERAGGTPRRQPISASRSPASAASSIAWQGSQSASTRARSRMRRDGHDLERLAKRPGLSDLAHGQGLHALALVGGGLDEAVVLQDRDRLADRRAAHVICSASAVSTSTVPGRSWPTRSRGAGGRRSGRGAASARSVPDRARRAGARFRTSSTRENLLQEMRPGGALSGAVGALFGRRKILEKTAGQVMARSPSAPLARRPSETELLRNGRRRPRHAT